MENLELKNQNLIYAQKFEEVNKSVLQSNDIFGKMKEEIQKVSQGSNSEKREN
jgi:hypothetical protein